jgi:hypothetical protein
MPELEDSLAIHWGRNLRLSQINDATFFRSQGGGQNDSPTLLSRSLLQPTQTNFQKKGLQYRSNFGLTTPYGLLICACNSRSFPRSQKLAVLYKLTQHIEERLSSQCTRTSQYYQHTLTALLDLQRFALHYRLAQYPETFQNPGQLALA